MPAKDKEVTRLLMGSQIMRGQDMSWREKLSNSRKVITFMNRIIVLRCFSKSSVIHIHFVV
jgi:hypothetical protein